MNAEHGDKIGGTPFYLLAKGDKTAGPMALGAHVNPRLSLHSDYFKELDTVMKCVEKASGQADENQRCQKEFKQLRLAAFNEKLLYHQVNKRHFMKELAFKNGMG